MKIEVNNITLHYETEGQGNPLILLHGNGENHTIFRPLMEKLKKHFTVYAIDSRNHGQSSRTEVFNYEAMAEDIYQFIQKLKLTDISILGFSDGAIVATMLELEHPAIFDKMVLLGINLKPSDFTEENIVYLEEEYAKTKDPLVKMMLEEPNISLDSLKAITTPSLVIRAEDELYYDALYDNITAVIPHAKLLIMKGHDHGSYIVDNDMLYDDLMGFLAPPLNLPQ